MEEIFKYLPIDPIDMGGINTYIRNIVNQIVVNIAILERKYRPYIRRDYQCKL